MESTNAPDQLPANPSVDPKQQDGLIFNLGPTGNGKVIALLSRTVKKSVYVVNVVGEMSTNMIKVDVISMAK